MKALAELELTACVGGLPKLSPSVVNVAFAEADRQLGALKTLASRLPTDLVASLSRKFTYIREHANYRMFKHEFGAKTADEIYPKGPPRF